MSYAIAVLPDEEVADWAMRSRRGLAQNFPPHVTVKSRFWVKPGTSVNQIAASVNPIFDIPCFGAKLEGPVYVDGRIRWVECLPGNDGADVLNTLHRACVEKIMSASYARDYDKPGPYELDRFRPHMTLDWDDHGISVPRAERIYEDIAVNAVFVSWVLMEYSEDHLRRGVRVVYSGPLGTK